ncbi:MAG TPA: maleylpyruvate isomerase N-terminal domain-containing protein [Acidimicrobiales bacterium]
MTIQETYLATAAIAADLLGRRETGDKWNEPSVLPEFAVRGLAGHVARAILQVEWFLDMPVGEEEPVTAVQYYAALRGLKDVESELNVGVRQRGEETAAGGWARLYLDATNALERLKSRLPDEPRDRRVVAFGRSLLLEEYLKTRLIELTVHIDDLCLSIGMPTPPLPEAATTSAIAVLVGVARARNGDLAVLRALARRERAADDVLHVL